VLWCRFIVIFVTCLQLLKHPPTRPATDAMIVVTMLLRGCRTTQSLTFLGEICFTIRWLGHLYEGLSRLVVHRARDQFVRLENRQTRHVHLIASARNLLAPR